MIYLTPQNCSICNQMYNNDRIPLILISCGHTYCRECLDSLLNEKNEINCPECKQITNIAESPIKSLPKNRGLLDLILYNEQISKSNILPNKIEKSTDSKESIKLLTDFENVINKLDETYNKLIEEHSYLIDISDVLVIKEVDLAIEGIIQIINEYRQQLNKKIKTEFEKVNLLKTFKHSILNYKYKIKEYREILSTEKERINSEEDNSIEQSHINTEKTRNFLTTKETDYLKNEKEFIELYNLTLKQYSKELYNPCKYFFLNKFQFEKLQDDIKKTLKKVCSFDENIFKYNIESLNNYDEKKILKEIQECCIQTNLKKLKFLFSHLRINPNFLYSEIIASLTPQTNFVDAQSINSNLNIIHSNSANNVVNLAGSNNSRVINQNTSSSQVISRPQRIQSNTLINIIGKDKIINLYTCLKNCKDKNEIQELTKYLIEEYNYLPLKFESESVPEMKFVRDFEWTLNLNLL